MKTKKVLLGTALLFSSLTSFGQQIGDGKSVWIDTFNKYLKSGAYNTHNTVENYPHEYPTANFKHLIVSSTIANSGTTHHQLQISSRFDEGDKLYFRNLKGNMSTPNTVTGEWHEIATRGKNVFNGSQRVNGTLSATEIIVETKGADFVFAEGYNLPTLGEVKEHINSHKHLPGIPSAAEMQENGMGVSEISTKLLQKVEELTLYVIQQNEKIEMLENELKNKK